MIYKATKNNEAIYELDQQHLNFNDG